MNPRDLINISRLRCPRCMAQRALEDLDLLAKGDVDISRRLNLATGFIQGIATNARAFCILCRVSP